MIYENNGLFTACGAIYVCEIQDGDRVKEYCGAVAAVIERDFDTLELARKWLINNGYELE